MRSRGTGRAEREAAEKEWAEARREAERLERGKPHERQKPESASPKSASPKSGPSKNGDRKKMSAKRNAAVKAKAWKKNTHAATASENPVPQPTVKTSGKIKLPKKREVKKTVTENEVPPSKETASTGKTALDPAGLAESINRGYARLASANRDLTRASYVLEAHETRTRVENAEALLEAKTIRAMDLYLEGLMDTEEHRKLHKEKTRAELAHFDAKAEVERLKLLVRLMEASSGER